MLNGFKFRSNSKEKSIAVIHAVSMEEDQTSILPTTKAWKPITLRQPFILATTSMTLAIICILQYFLIQSERKGGLILSQDVTSLPLSATFVYLYLPTILAVLYGIVWSWIDLDVKRMEPYRQLSKPEGASAGNSLLLSYSVDFFVVALVKSLRRRHWPVFMSSLAITLLVLGITPLQAAMFAKKSLIRASTDQMAVSSTFITAASQAQIITANYSYSVFGITWLDEKLPPYMSHDVALTPFRLSSPGVAENTELWLAPTTAYGVDVQCDNAKLQPRSENDTSLVYAGRGCNIPYPFGPTGNDTIDDDTKQFSASYAGFNGFDGLANYYLSPYCPSNDPNIFFVSFAENKRRDSDPHGQVTALLCTANYYQQSVSATVRGRDQSVVNITTLGDKTTVPDDIFNRTALEWPMGAASQQPYENIVRGPFPASKWPDETERLSNLSISLSTEMMVGVAVGASKQPVANLLNAKTLAASYQNAYSLLFARYMTDVLQSDFDHYHNVNGSRTYNTQAIYMAPAFTYAVESLLACILVSIVVIFCLHRGNAMNLTLDPGPQLALMKLVSQDCSLLAKLAQTEGRHNQELEQALAGQTFHLTQQESSCRIQSSQQLTHLDSDQDPRLSNISKDQQYDGKGPVPWALSHLTCTAFWTLQVGALATLIALAVTSRSSGLSLPAQNLLIRQLIEHYIPTLVAAGMEPLWNAVARALCLIAPLRALRFGNARTARSIALDYTSMPPQIAAFKAAFARDFGLSLVCTVTILASFLTVAMNRVFDEAVFTVATPMNFSRYYEPVLNQASDLDLKGLDHFYILMSNLTSGTPLPPWTDGSRFYVPVALPAESNDTTLFEVNTTVIELDMNCQVLTHNSQATWSLVMGPDTFEPGASGNLSVSLDDIRDDRLTCSMDGFTLSYPNGSCPAGPTAMEIVTNMNSPDGSPEQSRCRQLVVAGWIRSSPSEKCVIGSHPQNESISLSDNQATLLACEPTIIVYDEAVVFDRHGVVQPRSSSQHSKANQRVLQGADQLVLSINEQLISPRQTPGFGGAGMWHSDSFPSDWNNYLMSQIARANDILDPKLPPPTTETAGSLFESMYTKLFSTWLALHHEQLLTGARNDSVLAQGQVLFEETRIIVTPIVFWAAAIILTLYIVITTAVYASRPGYLLSSYPTTMASSIAMFAASHVMEDISHYDEMSIAQLQDRLNTDGTTFGYGSFIGVDCKSHIGVERDPFVRPAATRGRRGWARVGWPWKFK